MKWPSILNSSPVYHSLTVSLNRQQKYTTKPAYLFIYLAIRSEILVTKERLLNNAIYEFIIYLYIRLRLMGY